MSAFLIPATGKARTASQQRWNKCVRKVADGLTRDDLQRAMPPGAARNALDCAFWDLAAKRAGRPVYALAGLAAAASADDGLHDLARHAGRDGERRP